MNDPGYSQVLRKEKEVLQNEVLKVDQLLKIRANLASPVYQA